MLSEASQAWQEYYISPLGRGTQNSQIHRMKHRMVAAGGQKMGEVGVINHWTQNSNVPR